MIRQAIINIVDEASTPSSKRERGYLAGAIAFGHFGIGYAFSGLPLSFLITIAVLYAVLKEGHDYLLADGQLGDGVWDTVFVCLGLFLVPGWVLLLAVSFEAIRKESKFLNRRQNGGSQAP